MKFSMKKFILVLICIASAASTGCSQLSEKLSYAMDLQEILNDKYDSDEVQVTINNNILTVSFIDDKFSGYSDVEKQQMVREITAIATDLEDKPELSGGVVKFVTKGLDGLVKTSTSETLEMKWEN